MNEKDLIRKAQIFFEIHAKGHKKAKSIKEIESYLGCDNRTARNIIHKLRVEHEMPIISLSADKTTGYFLYSGKDDDEFAKHFINETFHRIDEIRKIIKPIFKIIKNHQLTLF
jgi:transcription termination factor NusB